MSMHELSILNGQIDRLINDLVDLDMRLAKRTGRVSIGFKALKEMKIELSNNARRAIFTPEVSQRDLDIYDAVCNKNCNIGEAASKFGVSRSTVRRAMDRVSDVNRKLAHTY